MKIHEMKTERVVRDRDATVADLIQRLLKISADIRSKRLRRMASIRVFS
jgi:hypothetical protein